VRVTPIPSTSPKLLARERIGDLHIEAVHDPRDGQRYLSIGVGEKPVRRTWLNAGQANELTRKLVEMIPLLWSK
jgi:hypothetical protein